MSKELTPEQIEKVSQLLLSIDDINTELALKILESKPFPPVLITEIFALKKLTKNEEHIRYCDAIISKYGSKALQQVAESKIHLGKYKGLVTNATITKNINFYTKGNELDGDKLAIALYKKYKVDE